MLGNKVPLSESIDKTLDIGAGLVEFLPLLDSCDNWVEALEGVRNAENPVTPDILDGAVAKSGYDISSAALRLGEIYTTLTYGKDFEAQAKVTVLAADKNTKNS